MAHECREKIISAQSTERGSPLQFDIQRQVSVGWNLIKFEAQLAQFACLYRPESQLSDIFVWVHWYEY